MEHAVLRMEHEDRVAFAPDLQHLIPGYLASRREDLADMVLALTSGDFVRLAVLGHNIKGTGGFYGFPEISELGTSLEVSAKANDRKASEERIAELSNFLDQMDVEFGTAR